MQNFLEALAALKDEKGRPVVKDVHVPDVRPQTAVVRHNHITRDIKRLGECDACDVYLTRKAA